MSTTRQSNVPSLVVAILASMTPGGANYAFGIYGADLKVSLDLTQAELDTIGTSIFVAGLFSWIPGVLIDWLGTRRIMAAGGFFNAAFMMLFWAVAQRLLPVHRVWIVPVLSSLASCTYLSAALIIGSAFKIAVNVAGAQSKGCVVGIAKAYLGLGAGTYACIYELIRQPSESSLDFLLVASFFALTCVTVPALILLPMDHTRSSSPLLHGREASTENFHDGTRSTHFRILYGSIAVLALVIVGYSMLELNEGPEETRHANTTARTILALFMVGLWIVPILSLLLLEGVSSDRCRQESWYIPTSQGENPDAFFAIKGLAKEIDEENSLMTGDSERSYIVSSVALDEETCLLERDSKQSQPLFEDNERWKDSFQQFTLVEMLQTVPAKLLMWTLTILAGAGTVPLNNMGQMVQSRGFPTSVTAASMSLFSVAQAIARLATGVASDIALHQCNLARPLFLVVASLVAVLANTILALFPSLAWFVFGVTLSGFAFGMIWPLMVLIVGEVFGSDNMAANYMFYDGFTVAVGTLLMTKFFSQFIYEQHVNNSQQGPYHQDTCLGMECFQETHLVVAVLSLTCTATGMVLFYRTANLYNKIKVSWERTQCAS